MKNRILITATIILSILFFSACKSGKEHIIGDFKDSKIAFDETVALLKRVYFTNPAYNGRNRLIFKSCTNKKFVPSSMCDQELTDGLFYEGNVDEIIAEGKTCNLSSPFDLISFRLKQRHYKDAFIIFDCCGNMSETSTQTFEYIKIEEDWYLYIDNSFP